jgi:hypothetical protein
MHRLVLILGLASACVADAGDEGFNIVNNLAPAPMTCTVSPGGAFIPRGLIDKQSPSPYVLTPELVSRISAAEGTEAQRTIALRGARVEVFDVTSGTKVSKGKFTSLFAASLSPMGKTTAAFDVITTDMLASASASGTTRSQYLAKIVPYGALGGSGDNVDGVPFEYPVTVCDGCVRQSLGTCPLPVGTVVINMANGCNPSQDGQVTCCTDAVGQLICPATVATAAR